MRSQFRLVGRENIEIYQVIIEGTKGLVLDPSTAFYKSILKYYTLTNKAVETH